MKNCPNCRAELEDHFELCWNCNYSLTEKRVVEIRELPRGSRELNCLRCSDVEMIFSGKFKFREGLRFGILGNFFEMFENRETFELYICPKCGKVEFFTPLD